MSKTTFLMRRGKSICISAFIGLFLSISGYSARFYVAGGGLGADIPGGGGQFNPLATVGFAISQAVNGDTIIVQPGTYSETNILINKQVRIFGNESGQTPGIGTKPVFNGTGSTPGEAVFVLQANNIEIRNFEIRVNQDLVTFGIFAAAGGFNGALIAENSILSTKTSGLAFNTYGILLGQNISPAGNDSSLITRNTIAPASGAISFGRGIRLVGGYGKIGGNDPDEGNNITGTFGIQCGSSAGGVLQIKNNIIFGSSAGIEVNNPTFAGNHLIESNSISPIAGDLALAMIEVKNHNKTGSVLTIRNNNFSNFMIFGVFSTKSNNVVVDANTFSPADTARNFICVAVNTKQQTSSQTETPSSSSITITGNNFQSAGGFGGTAIAFQNHFSGAKPPFQNVVIGGAGNLANTFGGLYAKFCELDARSGPSNQYFVWDFASYRITAMLPVEADFNLSNNRFDLGGGPKLPLELSEGELMTLEDRIQHHVDFDSLGFVSVIPNRVFVTSGSVLPPKTTSASINRALSIVDSDAWTLTSSPIVYSEDVLIDSSITLTSEPAGSIDISSLNMNGNGKVLNLNSDLLVNNALTLNAGNIRINSSSITLAASASLGGGSSSSYVETAGSGSLIVKGLQTAQVSYPIGTASTYTPTTISNSGTADNIGLRVQDGVLSNGLTGQPEDSVVGITWVANEATPGGSDLTISPQWPESAETAGFNRNATFFQAFNGSNWVTASGPASVTAAGANPYSAIYSGISADLVNIPLRISSIGDVPTPTAGNLFYVSDQTGDDTRTADQAKNPATPWKTISKAVGTVSSGDSVQVLFGLYNEANIQIDKGVRLFGNLSEIGTGAGIGTGVRPIINGTVSGSDSAIFLVSSPDFLIRNFEVQVDLDNVKHGIFAKNGNYNNLRVLDCRIFSTSPGAAPCARFNTYGIRLLNGNNDSIIVKGTNIEPKNFFANCAFGRGIRMLGGGRLIAGGAAAADSNRFVALYGVQLGDLEGPSVIENNVFFGQGVEITAPSANSGVHIVRNNRIFAVLPEFFTTLVEFKDVQNDGTGVLMEGNRVSGHKNIGVFSGRSRNVEIRDNVFIPSSAPADTLFCHVYVNTKQLTRATIQNPALNEITIQGNEFRGKSIAGGIGVMFANHNDDPSSIPAFGTVVVGGSDASANRFAANLRTFVRLDPNDGPSASIDPWISSPVTTMAPVADNFDLSNNLFAVSGGEKRPADMDLNELLFVEDKIQHGVDYSSLGFAKLKEGEAFVTENSFFAPKTTSPSLQRAVAKAQDTWTINIRNKNINEVVSVDKNLSWNVHPADSILLGGIAMRGQGVLLSLQDNFRLSDSLVLNVPDGGKISLGASNLIALPSAVVTEGTDNSYVRTDGAGSFIRRNVQNQPVIFPVGTADQYAPVSLSDANSTGDNFSARVISAITPADFTPALPFSVNTYAQFQWTICEDVPGGSNASVTFDWRSPANVAGGNALNSVVRNEAGNWIPSSASIGPNQTATASGIASFCVPFAVVASADLVLSTANPLSPNGTPDAEFCPGDTILVPFTAEGAFASGNQFSLVLSDATGSFAGGGTVISISPLSGTTSDTIIGVIPTSSLAGINYRVRVESSSPVVQGLVNSDSLQIFALPQSPVISGKDSLCPGETVQLVSSVSNGIVWSPGGETNDTISVSFAGTFRVKVTDSNGCSAVSPSFSTNLRTPPVAQDITFTPSLSVCAGDSITLTANPGGLAYIWSNGSILQNIRVGSSGNFSVIVVDPFGCRDTSAIVSAVVNPLPPIPVVTIPSNSDTVCSPNSLNFSTTASGVLLWSGTGITPNPTGSSVQISAVGFYQVSVRVTDANSCSSVSATKDGLIRQPPVKPAIIPVGSGLTRCADDTLVLVPSPYSAGNFYIWNIGTSLKDTSGVLNLVNPGTYSVTLTVDSNFCRVTTSPAVSAKINPLPVPEIVSQPNSRVCQFKSLKLSSKVSYSAYKWIGIAGDSVNRQVTIASDSAYPDFTFLPVVLQGTDGNGCVGLSDTVNVRIDSLPIVGLVKDSAYTLNDLLGIRAIGFNPSKVANFEWFIGNLSIGSSLTNPLLNYSADTSTVYTVQLTDVNGCQSKSNSISIRVASEVFVPNSFSPNSDGNNDVFKVYGFGVKEIQLQVWDRMGNMVYESNKVEECVEASRNADSVKGWDGKYKDKLLQQGAYIWTVKGKFNNGQDIKVTGGKNTGSLILLN